MTREEFLGEIAKRGDPARSPTEKALWFLAMREVDAIFEGVHERKELGEKFLHGIPAITVADLDNYLEDMVVTNTEDRDGVDGDIQIAKDLDDHFTDPEPVL